MTAACRRTCALCRKVSLLFLPILCVATATVLGKPARTAVGISAAVQVLADSLRAIADSCFIPAEAGTASDSLDLPQIFADYPRTQMWDDSERWDAGFLPYQNTFSTALSFRIIRDESGRPQFDYLPPFAVTQRRIVFDDSEEVELQDSTIPAPDLIEQLFGGFQNESGEFEIRNDVSCRSILWKLLAERFRMYRTLNLPRSFRPDPARDTDGVPVSLFVYDRDLQRIPFATRGSFLTALRWLAGDLRVYAGPTAVKAANQKLQISFYVALVNDAARWHHFLTIDETFEIHERSASTTACVAKLYPYVRVDNVRSLHWQYQKNPALLRFQRVK